MKADQSSESGVARNSSIELNQTWDMGRLIDLTCDYFNGMPIDMSGTLPSFQMRELDKEMEALCRGREYRSYTQEVRMCVQAGNYLETGAHLYPEMESVADVGLDRLFVSAVVVHIPRGKDEKVTAGIWRPSCRGLERRSIRAMRWWWQRATTGLGATTSAVSIRRISAMTRSSGR